MRIQVTAVHQEVIGAPSEKCTTAAITPAPAGIGMPTKYFLPGRPGFEGWGFACMLKRARRLAPATRNTKLAMMPRCIRLVRRSPSVIWGSNLKPQSQASRPGSAGFRQAGQHRGAAANPVADFDLQPRPGIENHVHARAKLDHADALSPPHLVPDFLGEYDAPGEQAGDLLEDHGVAAAG